MKSSVDGHPLEAHVGERPVDRRVAEPGQFGCGRLAENLLAVGGLGHDDLLAVDEDRALGRGQAAAEEQSGHARGLDSRAQHIAGTAVPEDRHGDVYHRTRSLADQA